MSCSRCHQPAPTGQGCAVCDPETLGTRLKAALAMIAVLEERITNGRAAYNAERVRADTLWRERDEARAQLLVVRLETIEAAAKKADPEDECLVCDRRPGCCQGCLERVRVAVAIRGLRSGVR